MTRISKMCIRDRFYADVSAIITIPEGFEEEFASGKEAVSMNQRPDDVNGVLLQQTINKYLDTMHAYEKLYPKQGISELHTRVQKNLNTTAAVSYTHLDVYKRQAFHTGGNYRFERCADCRRYLQGIRS